MEELHKQDFRWYAVFTYAREMIDRGVQKLEGNDVANLVKDLDPSQFSEKELKQIRGMIWRIYYHFETFASDIARATSEIKSECATWDEDPFDPIDPQKTIESTKKSENWSFIEPITQSQINSRLELARWIHSKHVNLVNRDNALRCVSLLLQDNPIVVDFIHNNLDPRYLAELDRRLEKCRRIDETAQFEGTTEEIYLRGINQIKGILESHNIKISRDVDDFILKLACGDPDGILNKIPDEGDRSRVMKLCEGLIMNEFN